MPVNYSQFLSDVLAYLPGCPEPAAFTQVRNAAIEFCERTDILRYATDPLDLEQDVSEYDIDIPNGHTLARVLSVQAAGVELQAASEDVLRGRFSTDWRKATGGARYFVLTDDHILTLCPTPNETVADGLEMVLTLRPSRSSLSCSDILWERYADYVTAGARARLAMMKGQSFSDVRMAAVDRGTFLSGVGVARMERNRQHNRPLLRMRPARGAF